MEEVTIRYSDNLTLSEALTAHNQVGGKNK